IDRVKDKIKSLENEIVFIKSHPRSIVPKEKKRSSIEKKKRWSLPSADALSSLENNTARNWTIGDEEDDEDEDEDMDEDMIQEKIANRFQGLLGSSNDVPEQAQDTRHQEINTQPHREQASTSPTRIGPPQLTSLVMPTLEARQKRLSLNPHVLRDLSERAHVPVTPTHHFDPYRQDQQPNSISNLSSTIKSSNTPVRSSSGVAGFYPPPCARHSRQNTITSDTTPHLRSWSSTSNTSSLSPVQIVPTNFSPPKLIQTTAPTPVMINKRNSGQPFTLSQEINYKHHLNHQQQYNNNVNDIQEPYKPPQIFLPYTQDQNITRLPSFSHMIGQDGTTNTYESLPNEMNQPYKRINSMPAVTSLPKFDELQKDINNYQNSMRKHSPQYMPRMDLNHSPIHQQQPDPFLTRQSVTSTSNAPPVYTPPQSPNYQEERKLSFVEKIFRKQIPFFKKRSASPSPNNKVL
ncbi:nusB, partial [Acrasis kona]